MQLKFVGVRSNSDRVNKNYNITKIQSYLCLKFSNNSCVLHKFNGKHSPLLEFMTSLFQSSKFFVACKVLKRSQKSKFY